MSHNKKMNAMRALTPKEQAEKLVELSRELFTLRMQKRSAENKKTHLFKALKKERARLLTHMNSKG